MKNIEQRTENVAALEKWFNGQTYLASGSRFRQRALVDVGFKKVDTCSIPDSIEDEKYLELVSSKIGTFFDPYRTEVPREIAEAKLRYALENVDLPEDSVVCAVDTLAMSFEYNPIEKRTNNPRETMWTASHIKKPKNRAEAREVIIKTFNNIMEGRRHYNEYVKVVTEERRKDGEPNYVIEGNHLNLLEASQLPAIIRVNTGFAFRLPGLEGVRVGSAHTDIKLRTVYNICDGKDDRTVEELADELIKIMEEDGVPPESVTGGIVYSNPRVRVLLGAEEGHYFEDDKNHQDIYLGFPKKEVLEFLANQSKDV